MFGLLVFSLKLIAFNRKKYMYEDSQTTPTDFSSAYSSLFIRILVLVVLVIAFVILYMFNH